MVLTISDGSFLCSLNAKRYRYPTLQGGNPFCHGYRVGIFLFPSKALTSMIWNISAPDSTPRLEILIVCASLHIQAISNRHYYNTEFVMYFCVGIRRLNMVRKQTVPHILTQCAQSIREILKSKRLKIWNIDGILNIVWPGCGPYTEQWWGEVMCLYEYVRVYVFNRPVIKCHPCANIKNRKVKPGWTMDNTYLSFNHYALGCHALAPFHIIIIVLNWPIFFLFRCA